MRNNKVQKIFLLILILLVAVQFVRPSETFRKESPSDFIRHLNPPQQIASILQSSCYDCHSYQPTYPWYSKITPVNWWLQHHINEGSEHLNFSLWKEYSLKKRNHILEECIETVEKGEMPLSSYTWMHPKADLDNTQREQLLVFFKSLLNK